MFVTQEPYHQPGHCAFTMQSTDPEGFIQGPEYAEGTIYLSAQAVREALREFGHATKEEYAELEDRLAVVTAQNEQLRAEVLELAQFKAAVDVLESEGYRTRHKPGPKVAG